MEENTQKQHKDGYDWLKQYQWQKGKSGNPGGQRKGKRLKTFALEMLENMTDEDKAEFLKKLDPDFIWEMAEGRAESKTDLTTKGDKIVFVPQILLDKFNLKNGNNTNSSAV